MYDVDIFLTEIAKQIIRMLYLPICHTTFVSQPYQSPTDEMHGV
jgi:hypothetical protein